MLKQSILQLLIWGLTTLPLFAAENREKSQQKESAVCLIEKYHLSGEYESNIIPQASFIKISGAKAGIQLRRVDVNRLQLLLSDFHSGKMPYSMSVDIKMEVRELSEGVLEFEGEKGSFRAVAIDKSSEKKDKISKKASIKGSYVLNKNKKSVEQFSFVLKPGFWMPVKVHINIEDF